MLVRNGRGFMSGTTGATFTGPVTFTGATTFSAAVACNADLTMGSGKVFYADAGTGASAPSIRFTGSASNTGFYASTADRVSLTRAGTLQLYVDTGGVTSNAAHTFLSTATVPAGTASAPSIQFTGSATNTGIYATTADQIQIARSGSTAMTLCSSGGASMPTNVAFTTNGNLIVSNGLRLNPTTTQTSNYTTLTTDRHITMNVAGGGTCTLVASPNTGQTYFIFNRSSSTMTLARNGNTLNGGTSDVSIAAGAGVIACWNSGTSDWNVSEAPAG